MIQGGLRRIAPRRTDYSLLHSFGATPFDFHGLPQDFSIYDGRPIPDQNQPDGRFNPPGRPLPMGCVAETLTFEAGLQNNQVYPPDDLYLAIPPGVDGQGRDIRAGMQTAIDRGIKRLDGTIDKELAYFNCYGAGKIDDFDAARFGLWINQQEKRGVIIGSWWYPEFENHYDILPDNSYNVTPLSDGILQAPSFDIKKATLHCWLGTGFESTYKDDYLQGISWQGMNYGDHGLHYVSREIYNSLMAQPWTGAFTITNKAGISPVPIGLQAEVDHLVYYVRHLFNV